jgi:hypothetical protein
LALIPVTSDLAVQLAGFGKMLPPFILFMSSASLILLLFHKEFRHGHTPGGPAGHEIQTASESRKVYPEIGINRIHFIYLDTIRPVNFYP